MGRVGSVGVVTRHALVVCTANLCRSPVGERLLARALADRRDIDGEYWTVSSAGTGQYSASLDPSTIAAADAVGIDIRDHESRFITAELLATDGADLIITMTRGHLRDVVATDPDTWPRTFTLKELARRTAAASPPYPPETFTAWRARIAAGRRASDLLRPDANDDVADPYGGPRGGHTTMIAELQVAIDTIVTRGPWLHPT